MKKPPASLPMHFKSVGPQAGIVLVIPQQVGTILQAASAEKKISHQEARVLLSQVKDVVFEENGLTRQQLDYELYLRTMQGD